MMSVRLRISHMRFDVTIVPSSRPLEPEVLKGLGSASVQRGGATIVATTLCQIPLCYPSRSLMGPRRHLREGVLRFSERRLGLVEATLFEECPPKYEACIPDLVEATLPRSA